MAHLTTDISSEAINKVTDIFIYTTWQYFRETMCVIHVKCCELKWSLLKSQVYVKFIEDKIISLFSVHDKAPPDT